jgi:hypothetical protein
MKSMEGLDVEKNLLARGTMRDYFFLQAHVDLSFHLTEGYMHNLTKGYMHNLTEGYTYGRAMDVMSISHS